MLFRKGSGVVAVVVAMLGCPATVAHAEVVKVPDVVRQVTTIDGWQVTLSLTDARYDAVPNMANALLSKEGYLSGRVTLTVDGVGDHPINTGQLVVGAQLGCQVNCAQQPSLVPTIPIPLFCAFAP